MSNFRSCLSLLIVSTLLVNPVAFANKIPTNGSADKRIKTVAYNKNNVVALTTHYGYSTLIELDESEEVLNVSMGDSIAWTVFNTDNKLFIKPIEENADTNLLVVSSKRTYAFSLTAKKTNSNSNSDLTYMLMFRYPQDEFAAQKTQSLKRKEKKRQPIIVIPTSEVSKGAVNMEYTRRGSDLIAPRRVFDDGKFTYFSFNDSAPIPAIFAVDSEKNETLVNFHKKDGYIVVQRIAKQFALRHGGDITCVFNKKLFPVIEKIHNIEHSASLPLGIDGA
ncbi:MAG: P-type conjugative transfer protein VirB9 [Sedimenticola sp.]